MNPHSPLRLFRLGFVLLLLIAAIGLRCAKETKKVTDTSTNGSAAVVAQQGAPIGDVAKAISQDVGTVLETHNGGGQRIVVFDETHNSRVGQVEIATMLVRLHDKYGLRRIALEGAFFDDGPLRAKWFHDLGEGDASRAVALRLLREGEIGACEFAAIAMPDVQVTGSESASEYSITLSREASAAPMGYLFAIAEKELTQDQIREANGLIQSNKKEEALKYILHANDWTKERYEKLTDRTHVLSTEDELALMRDLETKASESGAHIDDGMRQGLASAKSFFEAASTRTGTMVKNAMSLVGDGSGGIVAMNVGAAHTSAVVAQLKAAGTTFAVIRPASLAAYDEHGGLSGAAFVRKEQRASVDVKGLGAYLDGRHHKPQSTLGKRWLHSKAEIYHAATLVASAAAAGGNPPFDDLPSKFAAHDSITVDPSSFAVIDDHGRRAVIFKVVARTDDDDPSKTVELWVKTLKEPPGPPNKPPKGPNSAGPAGEEPNKKTLEEYLLDERKELLKEETKEEKKGEGDGPPREPVLLPISRDTKAVFATSREEALRIAI